jgi:hypothetical protein
MIYIFYGNKLSTLMQIMVGLFSPVSKPMKAWTVFAMAAVLLLFRLQVKIVKNLVWNIYAIANKKYKTNI